MLRRCDAGRVTANEPGTRGNEPVLRTVWRDAMLAHFVDALGTPATLSFVGRGFGLGGV